LLFVASYYISTHTQFQGHSHRISLVSVRSHERHRPSENSFSPSHSSSFYLIQSSYTLFPHRCRGTPTIRFGRRIFRSWPFRGHEPSIPQSDVGDGWRREETWRSTWVCYVHVNRIAEGRQSITSRRLEEGGHIFFFSRECSYREMSDFATVDACSHSPTSGSLQRTQREPLSSGESPRHCLLPRSS